jgi:hypothetical protein
MITPSSQKVNKDSKTFLPPKFDMPKKVCYNLFNESHTGFLGSSLVGDGFFILILEAAEK